MRVFLACGVVLGLCAGIAMAGQSQDWLEGRVTDGAGQSLAGAKVMALATRWTPTGGSEEHRLGVVVTDTDGRFRFRRKPEVSVVTIVATKDGRGLDWAYWSHALSSEPILRLGPAAAIEGQIVGDEGRPIGGASVAALLLLGEPRPRKTYSPLPGSALTVKTDAQGRFRFACIPEAALVGFDVSAPGRARMLVEPCFVPGQRALRFVLPPEGRLEGVVVEKNSGRPLADVWLLAMGSLTSGMQQARAKTDRQGHFSMAGLSGGKYGIEIVGCDEGAPPWIGTVEKVQLEAGRATSAVKIEAFHGGTLELSLRDAVTGEPIATAVHVEVSPAKDLRIRAPGRPSKHGVFRFCLAPGDYVAGDLLVLGYCRRTEKAKSCRVEAGKTARAILALTPAQRVTGTVRDPAGKPVPGAGVHVLPLAATPKELAAGDDGRFTLDPADIGLLGCVILVRHPQQNLAALETVGKDSKPLEMVLQPLTEVAGKVVDTQGQPVAGATVQAHLDAAHFGRLGTVATTRTGKDGRYQMALAGTSVGYTVTVEAPGYGPVQTSAPQHRIVAGPVKLKDMVLRAADRRIRGLAVDPQGKPSAGVIVSAKATGGERFLASAVTDDKGQFALEHLTEDPVIYLFATAPGRGWIGNGSIHPGETEVVIRVGPSHWD
jgi:hypothetical protein